MTFHEFNELRRAATALPPEQMRQLRDELEQKLAALPTSPTPSEQDEVVADPFMGLWCNDIELMDEIVADAYRKRREPTGQTSKLAALDALHRQMLADGLLSQLPDTAQDYDDPDDQPVEIKGEPLSETIIRERR